MSNKISFIITDSLGYPLGDRKLNLGLLKEMGYDLNEDKKNLDMGIIGRTAFSIKISDTSAQIVAHTHCIKTGASRREERYYFLCNLYGSYASTQDILILFLEKAYEETKKHDLEIKNLKDSFYLFRDIKKVINAIIIPSVKEGLLDAACMYSDQKKPLHVKSENIEKALYFLINLDIRRKNLFYIIYALEVRGLEKPNVVNIFIDQNIKDIEPAGDFGKFLEDSELHILERQREKDAHIKREKESKYVHIKSQEKSLGGKWFFGVIIIFAVLGWYINMDSSSPVISTPQKTITNSIGMEFVLIPAGEFDMGSPSNEKGRGSDEGPVHRVKIGKTFYMGKYEVTQKQWREAMGSNPSYFKGDNLPVEQISRNSVQAFIKKLNEKEGSNKYRLPSEAEWEYAARAGTNTRFSFGDDESMLGDYAWYDENSESKTHEVGQKKPNPWGLYDIHGNVWEWVQDSWHNEYDGAPTDGSSLEIDSNHVFRGGGYNGNAGFCRSADRLFYSLGSNSISLGFRLVMENATTTQTPKVTLTASPASIAVQTSDQKTFTNSIGMDFTLIPAGEFDMGSPSNEKDRKNDEGPVHRVKIGKAFYMGKFEVTQKQWRDIMGSNPSSFKGDKLPVEKVSWNDVQDFIKKLNEKEGENKYRLPSEAEWEYAARAGTTTRYSFGDDESILGDYAWYNGNSIAKTHEVGQKKPNPWGLYDMHGNVYEWVQDTWFNFDGAPTDGSAWKSDGKFRIFRGGGWFDVARYLRSAERNFCDPACNLPGNRGGSIGFRLIYTNPVVPQTITKATSAAPTSMPGTDQKVTPVNFKVFEKEGLEVSEKGMHGYYIVNWQGEKWIAIKGKENKIAKLVLEMGKEDQKTLATGETWSLGSGYEMTINAVDARATPRQVWFTLKKDGAKVDEALGQAPESRTFSDKQKAVYYKTRTILGETDVLLFTIFVDSIYSGATSDMVQFKYGWLIDESTAKVVTASTTPSAAVNTPSADLKTITNSIGMEFVLIPAGEFDMGSPSNEAGRKDNEGPAHRVKIGKPFYMGKYEVTQKQWREVMGSNPSNFKGDNLPVESVSWNNVLEFIEKLNEKEGGKKYRLPTEAEWEYAARAGTTTRYSFGDDDSMLGDYAWYNSNSVSRPHEVGQKKPNPWGLYDMHGNVGEWMNDKAHVNYDGAPTDGSSWESGNSLSTVFRSGDWDSGARYCRSAGRYYDDAGRRSNDVGFRLLRIL